jgi:hypothetical protein
MVNNYVIAFRISNIANCFEKPFSSAHENDIDRQKDAGSLPKEPARI